MHATLSYRITVKFTNNPATGFEMKSGENLSKILKSQGNFQSSSSGYAVVLVPDCPIHISSQKVEVKPSPALLEQ